MSVATAEATLLLDGVNRLCREAGAAIMTHHRAGPSKADTKADGSPVTAADADAERILLAGLDVLTPDIPVVAEEQAAAGFVPDVALGRFWLVDPLDGTREFVNGSGEFTVNVALIEGTAPVLGAVHAPALGLAYYGSRPGGAFAVSQDGAIRPISARRPPPEGLTVVASRNHGDPAALEAFLQGRPVAAERHIGSSLKLCLVAAGEADLYPRFGRTMEWDIAAGHAVLAAAGGAVETLDGAPLGYRKAGFENPAFVAYGRR